MLARIRPLLTVLPALLASTAPADVLRVDPGGGGDHLSIHAAVQAASDGDVILVLPGTYPQDVVIDGLDLWITATKPRRVHSLGVWSIRNVPAGERVVVSGIDIDVRDEALPLAEQALEILDCAGDVFLAQCHFWGRETRNSIPFGGHVAALTRSSRVSAIQCRFLGGEGASSFGGTGVLATESRFAAWDCEIEGGEGWPAPFGSFQDSEPGAPGLRLIGGSQALVLGGSVAGGDGGYHWDNIGGTEGDGGDVFSADAGTGIFLQAPQMSPGVAGEGGVSNVGMDGRIFAGQGAARFLGGAPSRGHTTGPFALAQTDFDVRLKGAPGERFGLFLQLTPPPFPLDELRPTAGGIAGHVSLARGSLVAVSAPMPPNGELSLQLPIPAIPAVPPTTGAFLFARSRGSRSFLGAPMPFMAINCGALAPDCNGNGRADLCDLLEHTAPDFNLNGVPDSCEGDCNGNGVPDVTDISGGSSLDFNGNQIPDECEPTTSWYVDPSATGLPLGTIAEPFQSLNQARNACINGDEIVLSDGLYVGDLNKRVNFGAREITVRSLNGPAACIIDLSGSVGRGFQFEYARGNGGVSLQGLTMRGGEAELEFGSFVSRRGGAIGAWSSDMRIDDCVFESNTANGGGALALLFCDVQLRGCTFRGNLEERAGSDGGGGAVWIDSPESPVVMDDCLFEANGGLDSGGALDMYIWQFGATLSRCSFVDNSTGRFGGAIFVHAAGLGLQLPRAPVHFDQCLFAGNASDLLGGAVSLQGIAIDTVTHCCFADNRSLVPGGAMGAAHGAQPVFQNSIIRRPGVMSPLMAAGTGASIDLERCNVEGGAASIVTSGGATSSYLDSVDGDPLFVDSVGPDGLASTGFDNDYRLGLGSVAVDSGNNNLLAADVNDLDSDGDTAEPTPLDLDGNLRTRDDPATPDTGIGGPPVVDLGPYERL